MIYAWSILFFCQYIHTTFASRKLIIKELQNGIFVGCYQKIEYKNNHIEVKKYIHQTEGQFVRMILLGTELISDSQNTCLQTARWLDNDKYALVQQENHLGHGLILSQKASSMNILEAKLKLIDLSSLTIEHFNKNVQGNLDLNQFK